jgi:hypothetical protein
MATKEGLLEAVFIVGSTPRLYSQDPRPAEFKEFSPSVEAGSNTSTVALRIVQGDEKGTQCLRV